MQSPNMDLPREPDSQAIVTTLPLLLLRTQLRWFGHTISLNILCSFLLLLWAQCCSCLGPYCLPEYLCLLESTCSFHCCDLVYKSECEYIQSMQSGNLVYISKITIDSIWPKFGPNPVKNQSGIVKLFSIFGLKAQALGVVNLKPGPKPTWSSLLGLAWLGLEPGPAHHYVGVLLKYSWWGADRSPKNAGDFATYKRAMYSQDNYSPTSSSMSDSACTLCADGIWEDEGVWGCRLWHNSIPPCSFYRYKKTWRQADAWFANSLAMLPPWLSSCSIRRLLLGRV